jgi:amino acid adenylation domain-containing protein
MGVLFREVRDFYGAFATGKAMRRADPPIQYADFAQWQRESLRGEALEREISYWKRQLSGLSVLELPTDRPRPAVQAFRGSAHSEVFPQSLGQALRDLSRREGVTLFMTLLATFQALLHRYTGQEDLVVGSPIAGRNRSEIEGLIGVFVNTLVMRTALAGNPSFRELLARVRAVTLGAYAHQDMPFEALVEELHPPRDLSRNPLFQVIFALDSTMEALELPGLTVRPLEREIRTSKLDWELRLQEDTVGLRTVSYYNTDLFDAATIRRMVSHYRTLLEGVVANPTRRLSDLPLITQAERTHLVCEWNATTAEYPTDCVHQVFEAQVQRTPGATAVVCGDEARSYEELNRRSNQLAHYLRSLGVGPETLVGIFMERSAELVVALLGVLKAGAAYLPLDPAYPAERLAFVQADARVAIVLTQERLERDLPAQGARLVRLDADAMSIARSSDENPNSGAAPENLAYVIYTSGSTGRPKGVAVPHRGLSNLLASMQDAAGLSEGDVLLAVTTLAFDIAGLELFLPLTVGGRVVVASRETSNEGEELAGLLLRSGANLMQATPATWRMLIGSGWKGDAGLRVLCGGEDLPVELARELKARCGRLWNVYGPTETTIWSTAHAVVEAHGMVPIGRPLSNTQVYVVDPGLQPVPIGAAGELYIGGKGIARGYFGRPDLTAERFVPDPLGSEPGARLYRTGDRARFRADGALECLGRVDNQVKIRGFRIELGEIEATLRRQTNVREAVVTAREDTPGDKRLVAYVVGRAEPAPSVTELRGFLRERLPEFMVPSAFLILPALPLTPNGKVDRRALPAPDGTRPELEGRFVAPRGGAEEVIAGIFRDVLRLDQVGVHDSFFEMGGHSLLATQVVSRLRESFAVETPLRRLFEFPTVAELAEHVETAIWLGQSQSSVAGDVAGAEEGEILA